MFATLPATQFVSTACVVHDPAIDGAVSTMFSLPARQKQQHEP
jgi:hypothetical protein